MSGTTGDCDDNCIDWPNPGQLDADGNGRGDQCECGDQTGDGFVNIDDIIAMNRVLFGLEEASPLCDANDDGACNIFDILAANGVLFGGQAYCERFPAP